MTNLQIGQQISLEELPIIHLSELKMADAGYRFEDEAGNHPYRGKSEEIPISS